MESDAEFVEMLWTSLWLEGWRFLRNDKHLNLYDTEAVFTKSWWTGYSNRIATRMIKQNKRAEEQYQPTATNLPGVAIALRGTKAIVDAKTAALFPSLRTGKGGGGQYSSAGAQAGSAAGNRANISGGRNNLGSRKQLS